MTETEEILFSEFDAGWGRAMQVKLITYANGTQDLHRQTGENFTEDVEKARKQLEERSLLVGPISFIGPTGAYMQVNHA